MITNRGPLGHLARVECPGGIITLCACLRLKHVPQLADHVIGIRVYEPRLQIWTHSRKHETTNVQQVIRMLSISISNSGSCTCWRGLTKRLFQDIPLPLVPEHNHQIALPVEEV